MAHQQLNLASDARHSLPSPSAARGAVSSSDSPASGKHTAPSSSRSLHISSSAPTSTPVLAQRRTLPCYFPDWLFHGVSQRHY